MLDVSYAPILPYNVSVVNRCCFVESRALARKKKEMNPYAMLCTVYEANIIREKNDHFVVIRMDTVDGGGGGVRCKMLAMENANMMIHIHTSIY